MTRYKTLFSLTLCFTLISTMLYGQSWDVLYEHPDGYLQDIFFVDTVNGWVVGNDGLILHSNNAGLSWHDHSIGTDTRLKSVFFTNIENGWIAGERGQIFHTVDAGTTWVSQESGTSLVLMDIFFIDDEIGWAVGCSCGSIDGIILRTEDGGDNWQEIRAETFGEFGGVFFISQDEGWVVGAESYFDNFEESVIWHTTDSGQSWQRQEAFAAPLFKVAFANESVGWSVGFQAIRTTDSGANWGIVDVEPPQYVINDVAVLDSNNIWLVTPENIIHSSDGGVTWIKEWDWSVDVGYGSSLSIVDSAHVWAVGGSSVIRYSEKLTSSKDDFVKWLPEKIWLGQNYPNPFNSWTRIVYKVADQQSRIELSIYTILGEEVVTLVDRTQKPGIYEVAWDGKDRHGGSVSSGVYIYRLHARSVGMEKTFVQQRKLVFLR